MTLERERKRKHNFHQCTKCGRKRERREGRKGRECFSGEERILPLFLIITIHEMTLTTRMRSNKNYSAVQPLSFFIVLVIF